ncbi:MAG: aminotransferase class III-fold pyridoxal phosphate-dependent enzyme [Pseudomonadales bacterium]|nr:aminotransferase class III-fold pyridoxal phosphate-dependent enzyme [Pseudomonadales bacterium]
MERDSELKDRADRVIPGGMYGHMSVLKRMPPEYPQFFERAEGCHLWDVNGNEYIDYMCSYGPMIAGYANPRIRAAADAQRAQMDIANGPAPVIVDLAERLVDQVSHAEWAMFAKNGNDATTICVMCARARSDKPVILVAKGAYHGAQPWANYMSKGKPTDEHQYFQPYEFNNVTSLDEAASKVHGRLAGIIVSAFRHDAGHHQELTDPKFAHRVREICDHEEAALILDDVRAGLRLSLDASWSALGVNPDLSAWGKGIANGEPLAAVLGNELYRDAMTKIFVTGSFWYQAAPMAAAIETLDVLNEVNGPQLMERLGQQLRDGLYEQAQRHGHGIIQSGPPQMPTLMFEDDHRAETGIAFCGLAAKEGVYLHPWHNMFLSTAHTEDDIRRTLEATDEAFRKLG